MPNRSGAEKLLNMALSCDALLFGEFKLKTGRPSPYFMNFGKLTTAAAAALLGELYAQEIRSIAPDGALLLGLPYKGIPLVALACAATTTAANGAAYSYAFLRKEAKEHGEGGDLVGTLPVDGRPIILLDDVLTAGATAIESLHKLSALGIQTKHLVIGFDRQEQNDAGDRSAEEELREVHGVELRTLATASDLLHVTAPDQAVIIKSHLTKYGNARAQAKLA